MKRGRWQNCAFAACFAWMLMVFLTSCSTAKSPLVNWDKRIGNYSYALALQDLGKPLHSTTLSDGTIVADWRIRKSETGTPDTSEPGTGDPTVTPTRPDNPIPLGTAPAPNEYLRLTFGSDQKLTGWKKYSQYHE